MLKEYLNFMVQNMMKRYLDQEFLDAYIKDNDGAYHRISEVDLLRDRIMCDDRFWYCYDWIVEDENEGKERLFIEM
jgi:hypothetical protein